MRRCFTTPGQVSGRESGANLVREASERLRAPGDCRDLAALAVELLPSVHAALTLDAAALVDLLQRADAFRRPERFALLLAVCEADVRGRPGRAEAAYRAGRSPPCRAGGGPRASMPPPSPHGRIRGRSRNAFVPRASKR